MSRTSIKVKLGTVLTDWAGTPNGRRGGTASATLLGNSTAQNQVISGQATVAADIAVLVADGASPTQAHVTTLNTDWAAFNTAATTLIGTISAGLNVTFDPTAVLSITDLRRAFDMVLHAMQGSTTLTP